ncbi:hypothetical protein [Leisingera sp. M523]|uniref:hypothetical protein n=1 Tax=Leisingera sp. M523 TaxID=2867013 RepID=UPI0021A46339|nr:hypothetical protein [Leisingera sp. M523]
MIVAISRFDIVVAISGKDLVVAGARLNNVMLVVYQNPVTPAGAGNALFAVHNSTLKLPGCDAIRPALSRVLRKSVQFYTTKDCKPAI